LVKTGGSKKGNSIKSPLTLEDSLINHNERLSDISDKILLSSVTEEYYGRKEQYKYLDSDGKIKTKKITTKIKKNPAKISYVKFLLGKNRIEIYGYDNAPDRMMVTINNDKFTLSEITNDDVKALLKSAFILGNKRNILGKNSNKALSNRNQKLKETFKSKNGII
jgi:hypothetical protein